MHLRIHLDYKALCRAVADTIGNYISKKPDSLVCLASGHTPLGVFECLVSDVRAGKLDLSQTIFVGLDEWVGIGPKNDGSCRLMMDEHFFGPANISESKIAFFDALSSDLQGEADKINALIDSRKCLDIMLVGIGTNGHIAMNEPGTSFDSVAHISDLAEETKIVGQKYFKSSATLSQGITLGLKHFREAKLPILMANGHKKTEIIRSVIMDKMSEDLPASIVQDIHECLIMLDQEAADGFMRW
jgi:glucosamine-6-phosphate isomerase